MGMHNKGAYTRVCARVNIRVYAKYARIIRVCVVRLYLSCTVSWKTASDWSAVYERKWLFVSADVRGEGMHDEPLRASAWEAIGHDTKFW